MNQSDLRVRTQLLIRKPVAEVFEAFVDPAITSRFWFSRGSGRLEPGKQIRWDWEMYGFSIQVKVREVVTNKRILIEWCAADTPAEIEWEFTSRADGTTLVAITNSGFSENTEEALRQALHSIEGFAFVLAGLKALLEHGIQLNLVADRFPDGLGGAAES